LFGRLVVRIINYILYSIEPFLILTLLAADVGSRVIPWEVRIEVVLYVFYFVLEVV
jgi:hypothetical protein